MSSEVVLVLFFSTIGICLVRARKRGRSLLGWGLFALFLWPIALLATWFVGPKKRATVSAPPAPVPNQRKPPASPVVVLTPLTLADLVDAPLPAGNPVPVAIKSAQSASPPSNSKDKMSVIDVTGPEVPLRFEVNVSVTPAPTRPTPAATSYTPPDYSYEQPKLGKQYRKKLKLTQQQVDWLDKFWPPQNVFLAVAGCRLATVQLYLRALPLLEAELQAQGVALSQLVARCQQRSVQQRQAAPGTYGWDNYDERYVREQAEATVYATLFRRCENVVRDAYGHKRKLAAEFTGLDAVSTQELEQQLGQPLATLLPALTAAIDAPDEGTEQELNLQNVTRWKQQLDGLAAQLSGATTQAFVEGVQQLGQRNARNPALENIFFDASKLMAKYDREHALRLYVQYVYHDLNSVTINSKQLAKTIRKSLFPQPEYLQRFEALVSQLVRDKDLPRALAQVPIVYARQRRKIELDAGAIQQVKHQHAGTVELLNEYLQDEAEPALPLAPLAVASELLTRVADVEEEIQLVVPAAAPTGALGGAFVPVWGLTAMQEGLLALFAGPELVLPQAAAEAFAREHGALRNQLIDSINEQCYERLDDVLIEEDGDTYTIYQPYYQQLTAAC